MYEMYWDAVWDRVADEFWTARNHFWRARLNEQDEPLAGVDSDELDATSQALREAVRRCAVCTKPATLEDKAVMADDLRGLAVKTDSPWLLEEASYLGTGAQAEQVYIAFWHAYEAYQPEQAVTFGPPSPDAAEALRLAAIATLETRPATPEQLGEKLRIANAIGVHNIIKKSWAEPCRQARWVLGLARTFHEDLPFWFYLDAIEFDPAGATTRPANIGRADRHFIRQAINALGEGWRASISADAERLR